MDIKEIYKGATEDSLEQSFNHLNHGMLHLKSLLGNINEDVELTEIKSLLQFLNECLKTCRTTMYDYEEQRSIKRDLELAEKELEEDQNCWYCGKNPCECDFCRECNNVMEECVCPV